MGKKLLAFLVGAFGLLHFGKHIPAKADSTISGETPNGLWLIVSRITSMPNQRNANGNLVLKGDVEDIYSHQKISGATVKLRDTAHVFEYLRKVNPSQQKFLVAGEASRGNAGAFYFSKINRFRIMDLNQNYDPLELRLPDCGNGTLNSCSVVLNDLNPGPQAPGNGLDVYRIY